MRNVIPHLGFTFHLYNRTGLTWNNAPPPLRASRRITCPAPQGAPSNTNYPWLPQQTSQHKAERARLEKPKTLIFNMSYMVMNTMQRDPRQPRGPGNPPSPKSRAAPAPGEGVRETWVDGKAPQPEDPGSGLPAIPLGGSHRAKGFQMGCLGPRVQVSTSPSQKLVQWAQPASPTGLVSQMSSWTWQLSVHSEVLLYRQGALPES